MAAETKKAEVPPYIAFSTFLSFIKGLAKTGIPSRIDKSLLRNMSGGNQSALISALKWFGLIDDAGVPSKSLEALVKAGDAVAPLFKEMLPVAYTFMADGTVNLERATGSQIEEKFKAYGLSGSTIVKAMAFFLSACKEATVPLSAHIKLPKIARTNGGVKAKAKKGRQTTDDGDDGDNDGDGDADDDDDPNVERFEIPIPGKSSVKVIVPHDLDADDWEMLQSMITVYIKRWKGFKSRPDNGDK